MFALCTQPYKAHVDMIPTVKNRWAILGPLLGITVSMLKKILLRNVVLRNTTTYSVQWKMTGSQSYLKQIFILM